jgi:hypothetical protein
MIRCRPSSDIGNGHKTRGFHIGRLRNARSSALGISKEAFLCKYLQNDTTG